MAWCHVVDHDIQNAAMGHYTSYFCKQGGSARRKMKLGRNVILFFPFPNFAM